MDTLTKNNVFRFLFTLICGIWIVYCLITLYVNLYVLNSLCFSQEKTYAIIILFSGFFIVVAFFVVLLLDELTKEVYF